MRLLHYTDDGDISLTEFFESDIPKYAILSHRWKSEEVTFRDMIDGPEIKRMKAGYKKIEFCGEQARCNGLQYFWVDTCCIDKSSSAELGEAINSMFSWYQNSTKCFVYFSDVSTSALSSAQGASETRDWDTAFRKSEWFSRGWTLQELVAPTIVEFFSVEGRMFGDKRSLEHQISERTGIPASALRGKPLSEFSVVERMSWAKCRETFRQEDIAYSLLGIFDVKMPLIYSEGRDRALQRLHEEIEKATKGSPQENFSVPFSLSGAPETETFVARESELSQIHRYMHSDGSRRTVVLHGLGGIGKTQLSIAYAIRHKNDYSGIFWLNIKDENALKQSFVKIAKQIFRQHPSAFRLDVDKNENVNEIINEVKAWLSRPGNTRWLMLFDNYDTPKLPGETDPSAIDVRDFFPESYQGSIIITTRSSDVAVGHRIRIKKLDNMSDSLKILSDVSGREGLESDPDAVILAEKLDGLPLALATAGAYLHQVALSLHDYLRLYEQSWSQLVESSPKLASYDQDEDRMLYTTWQVSLDRVKQQNEDAARLLCFWAYLDSHDIWFELLQPDTKTSEVKAPYWFEELMKNQIQFHRAMRLLNTYGLVEVATASPAANKSEGYSIHKCVYSWTIHVLNQTWNSDLALLAVELVAFTDLRSRANLSWLTLQRLLQHALRCSYMICNNLLPSSVGIAAVCQNLGYLFARRDRFAEAENMYLRALQEHEVTDPNGTYTVDTLKYLGNIYHHQGRIVEAEKLLQRAIEVRTEPVGLETPEIIAVYHHLTRCYITQGRISEAEMLAHQTIRGYERIYGPNHILTFDALHTLGVVYRLQGRLDEAEATLLQSQQGLLENLGPEDPRTLHASYALGLVYIDEKKPIEAERILRHALDGMEKGFGPHHTSTLYVVNCLGNAYRLGCKLVQAEDMLHRSVEGLGKALGSEHGDVIRGVYDLGILYQVQNKLLEAEEMFRHALLGYQTTLGVDHRWTRSAANALEEVRAARRRQAKGAETRAVIPNSYV